MSPTRVAGFAVFLALFLGACIADTKFPPDATTEFFPCITRDLPDERVHPETVLGDDPMWAGWWTTGEDQWHIGITDPGAVEWSEVCPEISDPDLVVHEAPHPLSDLEEWLATLEQRFADEPDPGSFAAVFMIVNGQYVIEIEAPDLNEASRLTESIPFDAWIYGGPVR